MTRYAIIPMVLALSLAALASPANADPAYRKDDIIKHFVPRPDLGPTRGLCIGTEAECNAGGIAKPAAIQQSREAFDLVVTFDLNSDTLTEQAKANLMEFAKALKDPLLSAAAFSVEGHTDARGTDSYNLALSERRAAAVVQFLTEQGVPPGKLQAKGLGKAQPRVADVFDPANRRVETKLRAQ
jgi:outer membrane protein OmpA-like peptidoglycan-associated protein